MANSIIYSSILSTRAQKEIAVSWDWYEERLQGLGDRFVNEVIEKIANLQQSPYRYPTKYKQYKEAGIDTFPFLIIYRINKRKKIIRVVSVFHTSRNQKKKY